ncbi:hypothetical protein P4E94_19400 [Pontiellaceae bacterium B12219]|nr:hypothetical protein [Pontiellaceae bacterium B12219]
MDLVASVLKEIAEGRKSFRPAGDTREAIEDFQSIAKVLVYCAEQGWLNSFKPHSERWSGNDWYDSISVLNGLSLSGEQYLNSKSQKAKLSTLIEEDILELKPNFMGIGINLNALTRWIKAQKN